MACSVVTLLLSLSLLLVMDVLLLAVQVCLEDGALICPETGRRFPVVNGIPNMLLNEDEV